MERIKLNKIKANPNNPRIIRDGKFKKLVKSIKEFPEMLEARPVVVNPDMVVLGGNMRLKALREAGVEEAPVYIASWDEVKQRQFIIKDNVGFGEWDWDALANEWDEEELGDWGLDVWQPNEDLDYSLLDDEDEVDDQIEDMALGVKKAIQIEFEPEHYEEAFEIVKFWREQDAYVGKMILDFLKSEKGKI
jgi:hypothetical protein